MIRHAHCAFEALEEIYAFANESEYAALHQILETHHTISVHLSEDEFDRQLSESHCLKVLAKRASRRQGYDVNHSHQSYREHLVANSSMAAGTVFIVNDEPVVCEQVSQQHGACILSLKKPQAADYLTRQLVRKEIRTADSYRTLNAGSEWNGWRAVLTTEPLTLQRVPLNSLVIVDNYLLGEKGDKLEVGQRNLIDMLQGLLPPTLSIDFHLLLVTNNGSAFLKSKNLTKLTEEIRLALARPYEVKIGVITRKNGGEHRRAIISNYYFGASHHGFSCFVGCRPQWANDLIIDGAFNGIAEPGYDVPWVSMHDELRAVRRQREENKALVKPETGFSDPINLVFGYCDNRLLELVA